MRPTRYFFRKNTSILLTLSFSTILLCLHANAQQHQQLLNDTTTIQHELKAARELEDSAPDSSEQKLERTLQSSIVLKYKKGILKSLTELGVLYHIHNQNQKAIKALQTALPYCDTGKAGHTITTNIYTAIAYRFMFIDMNDSAAYYYYKALNEIEEWNVDDPDVLINTYSQLIMLWLNLNEDPDAIRPDDKYVATAVSYLNKAERLEQNSNITLGRIMLSKGHISYLLHQFDSARFHYRRFIHLAQLKDMASQSSFVSSTYVNIASTFLIQKHADSAIYYAQQAIRKIRQDGNIDTNLLITSGYNLGEAYIMQRKYTEAIQVLLPALRMAQTQPVTTQYTAHDLLSQAYGAIGDYRRAWEHQQTYSRIRDSLTIEKNIRTISQMEMKYQVAERNKELATKELAISSKDNKIKSQKLLLFGILGITSLVILTSILLYRQSMHRQKIQTLHLQQEKEMALLQAMIDGEERERNRLASELHDGVGGLLGTIRMQLGAALKGNHISTTSGEFKEILLLLENAYDELRKTAHNLMPEILQYEGLEVATGIFCDRVRKADTLEINYETVGKIPRFRPSLELALYRMIQELLHNILKHARASEALVQLAFIGDCLSVTVEDNGIGIPAQLQHQHNSKSGMGIKTIQERIKKMGGRFDISSSRNHGTSINLEFNITGKDMLYFNKT